MGKASMSQHYRMKSSRSANNLLNLVSGTSVIFSPLSRGIGIVYAERLNDWLIQNRTRYEEPSQEQLLDLQLLWMNEH